MKQLLIVDDLKSNRLLLEKILEPAGYQTISADGGLLGVDLARREQPDIILMDLMMPDVDGYEALQLLRGEEATRNIPVIAITGNAASHDQQRIVAAGFDSYLFKPYKIRDLLAVISKGLASQE